MLSPDRPPSRLWLSLIIPLVLLLGLSPAQAAVQPTQAQITKTLWLGGDHYSPLIAPVPKGAHNVSSLATPNCGSYANGTAGLSDTCTNVFQNTPINALNSPATAAETGVQYNSANIGVRRASIQSPPVSFSRSSTNVFTGTASAQNHIIAGNQALLFGGNSKMAKHGGAKFKLDIVSNGPWELRFNMRRSGTLTRTTGLLNEARIGAWQPNLVVSSGITINSQNLTAAQMPAVGGSSLLALGTVIQPVDQAVNNLVIEGRGSGSLLINADFEMFVDSGSLLGVASLASSACWLGGSQLNHLNPLLVGVDPAFGDLTSVYQNICKTNTSYDETKGMQLQLVSFLADYDDDGIKDDVDNCTNIPNLS